MGDEDSYSVTVTLTRGTGTDDRDKMKATVEADTLEELDEKLGEMRDRLEDLAADVRDIQPEERLRQLAENQRTLEGQEAGNP
ncbi:hypothetical protein [Natronomonas gomsonensis]|uniref:DUF7389 domain-containing protein n=1 Tax=Natronomonas gomsonensis TaxID=1046043 RepID=UPI0015C14600|nr:hypothetical protein [Natronomonas gomsonensis]